MKLQVPSSVVVQVWVLQSPYGEKLSTLTVRDVVKDDKVPPAVFAWIKYCVSKLASVPFVGAHPKQL